MTFGTFFLYFVGAVVLLIVGWIAVRWLIIGVAVGTMGASDGARRWADRRATRRWQKLEDELEDTDG